MRQARNEMNYERFKFREGYRENASEERERERVILLWDRTQHQSAAFSNESNGVRRR